jgi:HSP20 family molecular chaperone IbpA
VVWKPAIELTETASVGQCFEPSTFPRRSNPEGVKAEFKQGILKIHAPISEDQLARKIEIGAA